MDLAETVDDLICIFDGRGDTTMDTLAMFVFGWVLAALFVLWLGRLVYSRFLQRAIDKTLAGGEEDVPTKDGIASTTTIGSTGTTAAATSLKKTNSLPRNTTTAGGVVSAATSGTGSSRSGASTPTTVRKRLTRQSPGPDVLRKVAPVGTIGTATAAAASGRYMPAPQCTGADSVCVLWVNDVLQWIYTSAELGATGGLPPGACNVYEEMLAVWLRCMNEECHRVLDEQGVNVEFIRVLPETHPPTFSNIFAECASNDDVTITLDCEATPAFQLKCHRQKNDRMETSHYRANVNRFRGRLNVFCVSEKLLADVKCDGWPEIKVALAAVGNIKSNADESQLQEVVSEIVTNALRNTEVHFNLAQYPGCPRLIRHIDTPMSRFHYDGGMNPNYTSTPNHNQQSQQQQMAGKRLLVKIVRAAQLGDGCTEPYCVCELDEPPQKNQTAVQKTGGDSPHWDEHFLFELSPHTAEVLMEVYDHATKPPRFLGLGIVGMDELLINPSQRQIISLQGRPYESDPVSGTLTVEFMFIEGNDIPNLGGGNKPFRLKESIPIPPSSIMSNRALTPTPRQDGSTLMNGGGGGGGEHLQPMRSSPMDHMTNRTDPNNRSTLVIHSVQRQPSQRLVKVELNDGTWREVERVEMPSLDTSCDIDGSLSVIVTEDMITTQPTNGVSKPNTNQLLPSSLPATGNNIVTGNLQVAPPGIAVGDTGTLDQRGRTKKRRDFFGTIKRRLGRSKNRSRSAGGPGAEDEFRDDSINRSISADRGRGASDGGRLLGVGNAAGREESSRRSSISEASGLSTASTRTYINEASNLVLETIENGVKKHYLVPLSLAQKSKWRKKGTKLHIFNDHTFIAKHLTGGTICQVCSKSVARRIGKQGYECRDCFLKCHKHCHVKVNDNCPTSTIHNIELSYIQNPLTDKNLRLL